MSLDGDKNICLICWKDMVDICFLPCAHPFCQRCIFGLLKIKKECPLCLTDPYPHWNTKTIVEYKNNEKKPLLRKNQVEYNNKDLPENSGKFGCICNLIKNKLKFFR